MSKLHVGKQELKSAYNRKRAAIRELGSHEPTALLLWCYAIECGLKLILLKKRQIHSTSQFSDDDLTHDLNEIQKKLGQPPSFPRIDADRPLGVSVTASTYHQLLRYGGILGVQPQSTLREKFESVALWIDEQI